MRPVAILHSSLALSLAASLACATAPKPSSATSRATAPASAPAAAVAPPPQREPDPAAAPRAPDAVESGLLFAVEPREAEIAVDGRPLGTVADLSEGLLRLAPGIYQVSLKATGYVTWRAEVALRSGTETIRVKLSKKP